MKKNIIAVICGIVTAAVIVTGALLSFGKMDESESIGSAAALSIALNDAGIGKDEAHKTSSVFERENGKYIFDVEFEAKGNEYEYDVDASTGEILKRKVENDKAPTRAESTTVRAAESASSEAVQTTEKQTKADTTKAESKQTNTTAKVTEAATTAKYIGLEAAKSIALKNAGASASEVKFTKAKLDHEDGRAVYEIEFIKGNTEYEYEIDAKSGRITDFEKEQRQAASQKSKSNNRYDDDDDDDIDEIDDDDD